jgi:hypothetical protein
MDWTAVRREMISAAEAAAQHCLHQHWGGVDQGSCGFSWINIVPKHKGNTRLGREERKVYELLGFRKDWTGREYQLWNPSGWPGQNIDVKEQGARAAAEVLQRAGMVCYVGSRLD